jgi:hypothetical protein
MNAQNVIWPFSLGINTLGVESRIQVARKESDTDEVVKQIQWLALKRGSVLDASSARQLS